jgi:S-adenosylmethionine decarboxylase
MRDPITPDVAAVARPSFATHGTHWLIDCQGVDAGLLADASALRVLLRGAAEAAGARILFDHFHDFGGDTSNQAGVTGVVLLAESHATIHTWPDAGFAAIDLFLCGAATEPAKAIEHIERGLAPTRMDIREQQRGTGN